MGYLGSKGRHYMIQGSKSAGCHLLLNPDKVTLNWQICVRTALTRVCREPGLGCKTPLSQPNGGVLLALHKRMDSCSRPGVIA